MNPHPSSQPDADTDRTAFGAPGIPPRWTSSAKEGLGTSYHTSCRVWFTLSHGIINEIYYPHVDQPNTRDCQLLITDGETFFHEEKRDLSHEISYPEKDCPFYQIINAAPDGRYRLVKHILTDPHRSVLLMRVRLEVKDEALEGKLRLYVLLAPHIAGRGEGNSGWCCDLGGAELLHAERAGTHLLLGCSSGFTKRSVGFAGASDGWQDLSDNFQMDWQFRAAEHGNIALTGEIRLPDSGEFTIAVGVGGSCQSTAAKLLQSLATPFEIHREGYVRQWQRAVIDAKYDFSHNTADQGSMYRLSRCVLLSHEDKIFQGALVASMSIPWGESKGDDDLGGYHLVWTRDLVQSASALLATGQHSTPLRALIWLSTIQGRDGSFPQNSWINGNAYWPGMQMDEVAAPILLAWRLKHKGNGLGLFDPWNMIRHAAGHLIQNGPVTMQERWEENAGYSPSTLATVIAGLVAAAEFAGERNLPETSDFILAYADWLSDHLEEWTVTTRGDLVPGRSRHYVRITPADPLAPDPHPDPDTLVLLVANGGGYHPARNVVGGDFLHLVRLGIRPADDPVILESLEVIDRVIKRDLPQGPGWRRYNHDGYGQKSDGGPFDGSGVGRSWPILTGERGHYELAAGRDPLPYIKAMEEFANDGGMISEQLWDDAPVGEHLRPGCPTGAAMPLCWSHAEYVSLVRSRNDGVCFDLLPPVRDRYAIGRTHGTHEIWSFRHPLRHMHDGKTLRIVLNAGARVVWSLDGWQSTQETETTRNEALGLWYVDLPTTDLHIGAAADFTFYWLASNHWEGHNSRVEVV